MLEKWKSAVDKGKSFGTHFDCLSLDLLLAKLYAFGFSLSTLKLIHSYLKNRKQRTKIDSTYSSWEETLLGIPQGSILGPLLFKFFCVTYTFQ